MVKTGLEKLAVTLLIVFVSATQAFAATSSHSHELVFGVPPQSANSTDDAQWKLLVEQVSVESGHSIRYEPAKNLEDFERKLSRGAYDFVLLNAHMYTKAHDAAGYQAFAKEAGQTDKGVIVVHRDSPVKTLADLNHKSLALTDPNRYTATVLTKAHLSNAGIEVKEEYVESDNSAYRAVVLGQSVAGAGEISTLNSINPNAHSKLRVIWSSKQYSSHAFAAHPRVKPEQLAKVQKALLNLNNDTKGKGLLSKVNFKGIAQASDREWDDIRALKQQLAN
jgi:phosphonate transport system substrate-binding protein